MRDIQETRFQNFHFLVEECAHQLGKQRGAVALLSTRSGVPKSLLSMLVNEALHSETGKRRQIGDDTATKLEAGMDKAPGWMDVDRSQARDFREAALLDKLRALTDAQRDSIERLIDEFQPPPTPPAPPTATL